MAYYLSQKKTKNLIRYPYAYIIYGNGAVHKDVTITFNSDRSITLNGVASGDGTINLHSTYSTPLVELETVVLSMTTIGVYSGSVYLQVASSDGVSSYTNWSSTVTPDGKPVVYKYPVYLCNLYFKEGATFDNFTVYPMLNEGAEALPYEEPIDYNRIKESNLLDLSSQTIRSSSKIRITQYGNILVFKGTLSEWQTIIDPFQLDCLEQGKTYTLSCNQYYAYGKVGVRAKLQVKSKTDNSIVTTYEGYSGKITFTVDNKQYTYYLMIQGGSTKGKFHQKLQWMLNEGSTEKTFKQYHPDFNAPVKIITRGKNLIPFPYYYDSRTMNNVTITVNEDGSLTARGTATADVYFSLASYYVGDLSTDKTYYLSGGENNNNFCFMCNTFINNKYVKTIRTGNGKFTVSYENIDRVTLFLFVRNGTTVDNTLYPMLNEGTTALPYESYNQLWRVRSGALIRNPKNLIPFPYGFTDTTINGITRKKNEDGSITFTGTATADFYLRIAQYKVGEFPTGTYYLSGGNDSANISLVADGYLDGAWKKTLKWGNGKASVDFNGYNIVNIFVYVKKGATVNYTLYPILNEGTTAEPYFIYD